MIAMRYGTIPVVRQTGGLADTVEPWNKYEKTERGSDSGISMHMNYSIRRKMPPHYTETIESWSKMVVAAMEGDYTWNRSAGAYQNFMPLWRLK